MTTTALERIYPPVPLQLPTNLIMAPNSRAIQRAYQRGELIRLGPGIYMKVSDWLASKHAERFLAVLSAKVLRSKHAVFGAETALLLAGFPVFRLPAAIVIMTDSPSGVGPQASTVKLASAAPAEAQQTLRYVPRIHTRRVKDLVTAQTGSFTTIPVSSAVADVSSRLPLKRALTAADGLARFGEFIQSSISDALAVAETLESKTRVRHAQQVLDLARPGAATPLETGSRCVMLQHGFQEPVLQQPHYDEHGVFLGRTDDFWEDISTAGESDGRIKYSDPRILNGRSMEQALMDEKIRQQQIEATGIRIIRWMWEDMMTAARLVKLLVAAGVPRDPSWVLRLL